MDAASGWTTVSQKGRPYYYKGQTSTWNKPDELLTPAQVATGWTETSTAEGKPYWFNKENKSQTSWTPPAGWNDSTPAPSQQLDHYVSSSFNYPSRDRDQAPRDSRPRDDYHRSSYDQGGYRGPVASLPTGVDYGTQAEAEAAFNKLMKKAGVQPDWSWEQAIRATIQDPAFRAIKEPTARKEAFHKYQDDLKVQEKEREQERVTKLRNDFRNMLSRHHEIKHYTRWKTALTIIQGEAVYRTTDDVDEKKRLFREYVSELKQQYEEKRYQDHESAMRDLSSLMREVNVTPETRWEDARIKIREHPTFVKDDKYQTLADFELLDQFQYQIRRLWEDVNTIKQREKQLQHRQERKAREGFLELLREQLSQDKITPDTQWKDILPTFENDPRYEALLNNVRTGNERDDGSTPLDFFFDVIEDFDREHDDLRATVESAMKSARYRFSTRTSMEEFMDVVREDKRMLYVKRSALEAVFKKLQSHANLHEEDVARDEKRQARKAIDALRSRIKRLEPPVEVSDSYESVRPRLERYEEYTTLPEADRVTAFEKHISRLQEDIDRSRHRHRDERDRVRSRSHRRSDRRPRTRSPPSREVDTYEADRRRAVEQRERNYRRGSPGGLSPPPRRDYDDRDRRLREDRYDRERRERDAERERAYVSRADPFAKAADLDYGDSSDAMTAPPTTSRPVSRSGKRAGSADRNGNGRAKRVKTDNAAADEEKAVQSGSEEGEIEEV